MIWTECCATAKPGPPKQVVKLPSAAVDRIWNWPKVIGERVTQPEREALPLGATVSVPTADPEADATWLRTPPLIVPVIVSPFWVKLRVEPSARLVTAKPLSVCAELDLLVRLKVTSLLRLPLTELAEVELKPGLNPGILNEALKFCAVATPAATWKVKLALGRL